MNGWESDTHLLFHRPGAVVFSPADMAPFDEGDRFVVPHDSNGEWRADSDMDVEDDGRTISRRAVTGDAVTDHVTPCTDRAPLHPRPSESPPTNPPNTRSHTLPRLGSAELR